MKKFILISMLFALVCFFPTGCKKSSSGTSPSGGAPPAVNVPTTLKVFSNVTDPRIIEAGTSDGTKIQFFGNKDSLGIALDVYALGIDSTCGVTQIDLDTDGLPVAIHTPNGTRFLIQWDLEDFTAILTAVTPDGLNQVSTLVDFFIPLPIVVANAKERQSVAALGTNPPQNLAPRGGQSTWMTTGLPSNGLSEPLIKTGAKQLGVGATELVTNITSCDLPDSNFQVLTSVFDDDTNELIGTFPGRPENLGEFVTPIPLGGETLEILEVNCEAISAVLEQVCSIQTIFGPDAATRIFVALELALASVPIPAADAALLVEASLKLVPLIELYCATAGAAPIDGAPSVLDIICEAEIESTPDVPNLRLETCIVGSDFMLCADPQMIGQLSSFPIFNTIDLGSNTTIRSLVLDPSAPPAFIPYVATANISCLDSTSTVTIGIVGTDGYADAVVFEIEEMIQEDFFNLNVPGAEVGVQDTVTVAVELPDGSILSKTAFLVFD